MSLPPDVAQATADLCAALCQERAYVEAGDMVAVHNLRAHKQAVFERWRALVEHLPGRLPREQAKELAAEAQALEAYVRKTLDLTAALLVARSPKRGSA